MAFPVLAVPVPGSPTFNVDAQLFATGMATFAQAANALGSVIDLSLTSTSTTSLAIGTGSKTLTVQTGLGYVIGYPVRIASVASPSNFMDGIVTAYNTITGSMTVNVLSVGGSGTIASWNTMVLPGGGNFASLSNNKFSARQVLADEVTIASASTLDFTAGNSNQFVITGTVTVTAVTMDQGAVIKARCTGACPFTHGTNLQLQGGANYTASAGDIFTFTSNGTVVRVEITKADGTAVKAFDLESAASDPAFASTSSSKAATPDWSRGLLAERGLVGFFESPPQVYTTAGALTIAHGMGRKPKLLSVVAICQTAELGYSVGSEVVVNPALDASNASNVMSVEIDTTNISIRYGSSGFALTHKTSGSYLAATSANWRLVFRAWG